MNRCAKRLARRFPVAAGLLTLAAAPVVHAIVFRNDMTDAQSTGLATQGQFSGVGKVAVPGEFGTGNLILSDWVLTAKHVVGSNATATFKGITGTVYTDPDANSDVALIRLNTPASGAPIAPGFLGGESGKLVWLVGVGGYGTVANSGNGGASLNYSGVAHAGTNVVREYSNPYLYFDNANTGATSSVYESSTAPGDSGGPMFQQVNNVWYVVGETNGANGNGFVHTPTNPHQSFILGTIRTVTGNSSFDFPTQTAPTAFNWDADAAVTGASDGGGTWDTQRPNFRNAATGSNYGWDNGAANDVTFGSAGGTAGTVTIAATNVTSGTLITGGAGPTYSATGVTAHTLTFTAATSGTYTIAAGGTAVLTLVAARGDIPSVITNADAEISAPIAGTSGLSKNGVGTLKLSGNNTYSGTTYVNAGTLQAAAANALPGYAAAGRVTVYRAATLALNVGGPADWTATQISSLLAAPALVSGSTLALDTSNGDFAFGNAIGGSVGFAKSGAGTLTLTSANTYTGGTTLNAGTLALVGAGRLPTSSVTLGNGATLSLGDGVTQTLSAVRAATTGATVVVTGPGTLLPGATLGAGSNTTFDFSGLGGLVGQAATGVSVNGNNTVVKLPDHAGFMTPLSVGTGDYSTFTNTFTTLTLCGETSLSGVNIGNYHASGTINVAPGTAGKTLTLVNGLTGASVGVRVGINSAGAQSQSGVFDTSGMILNAFVGIMRLGDYQPSSGNATTSGTFTMTAGTLDAQTITLAYTAPASAGGAGGTTSGTFNQSGGTVVVDTLKFGDVGPGPAGGPGLLAQNAIYMLGDPITPATLDARLITAGAITTSAANTTATRTLNFVNGRVTLLTPSGTVPAPDLTITGLAGGGVGGSANKTLNVVLAASGLHALTAPVGGTITVTDSAPINGSGALTIDGAGTVVLGASNAYTGGTVVIAGTLRVAVAARTPLLSGVGTDLRSGRVIFDYASAADNPSATIRSLLVAGRPGDFATGTLRSTTATAARGLGYVDNGANAVTIMATLYGDADLDGGVSINDFNALAGNFGAAVGKVWASGDFDYDGGVSINDFNLLAAGFGQSLPASSQIWAGLLAFAAAHDDLAAFEHVTGVPEPATLAGLGVAGVSLACRRRRAC